MSEPVIPERWQGHYACIVDGEVEDAQLEQQLMEELGAAEAALSEATEKYGLACDQLLDVTEVFGAEKIKLQQQLSEARQERDRLLETFREIEWCGLSDYCLLCGRTKREGHNSVCRIAAALKEQTK
jgi:hypothetical protein